MSRHSKRALPPPTAVTTSPVGLAKKPLDATTAHPTSISQPMVPRRLDCRPTNNKTAANRGKPGVSENQFGHRRCVSYAYAKYAESIGKHPGAPRAIAPGESWYCWTCPPRIEFKAWLHFVAQGFTTILPLVIDKSDHRNTPVPAFPRYGFIALNLRSRRYPTQDGHSPSWRLMSDVIESDYGPIARPLQLSSRSVMAWQRLGRDGDGIVEVFRSKDGFHLVKSGALDERFMNKGDLLKIIDGAFTSFPAVCESYDERKREVEAMVTIFGRTTLVTLPQDAVEKV